VEFRDGVAMEPAEIGRLFVDRLGLRIEPEMCRYIASRMDESDTSFPIIAASARTGTPVRKLIDAQSIKAAMAATDAK
jgi:hypothetical protein